MLPIRIASLMLAVAVSTATLTAQTAGQEMKTAGHDTVAAGKAVGRGTKVAAKKTGHVTAVGATKTARGTKKVGKAIVGDKTPTTTPHDPPKTY